MLLHMAGSVLRGRMGVCLAPSPSCTHMSGRAVRGIPRPLYICCATVPIDIVGVGRDPRVFSFGFIFDMQHGPVGFVSVAVESMDATRGGAVGSLGVLTSRVPSV